MLRLRLLVGLLSIMRCGVGLVSNSFVSVMWKCLLLESVVIGCFVVVLWIRNCVSWFWSFFLGMCGVVVVMFLKME